MARRLFSPGDGPSEGLKILHKGYLEPSVEVMSALVDIMTFDSGSKSEALAQQRFDNATANQTHLDNFAAGIGKPRRGTASDEEVASIAAPDSDHPRPRRPGRALRDTRSSSSPPIKNSRLVLFNRCGHWAQLEHADEFNRLVADFIANN